MFRSGTELVLLRNNVMSTFQTGTVLDAGEVIRNKQDCWLRLVSTCGSGQISPLARTAPLSEHHFGVDATVESNIIVKHDKPIPSQF